MKTYFSKMKGVSQAPPRPELQEIVLAFFGSCLALALIGWLHSLSLSSNGLPLLIAPFGASAVLVFGVPKSPFSQPRNILGGHVLSATVGITAFQLVGDSSVLAISLAVPAAIALMHATQTLHPPGGATAFVTAAGGSSVHALEYWYVLCPCALGSILLIIIALIINNIPKKQRYPQFW